MTAKRSIIYRSRQGYAYQDKYALLKFLQYFQEQRLCEFYVDYPFGEMYSLDVMAVLYLKSGGIKVEKHIFEIKTGENFKKRKRLFAVELETLHKFVKDDGDVSSFYLIINPAVPLSLQKIKVDLLTIKEKKRAVCGVKGWKDLASYYYKDLSASATFKSEDEFISFIRRVNFDDTNIFENLKGKNSENSKLENQLVAEVKNIYESRLRFCCAESLYPFWVVVQELLEVIKQSAGSKENMLPNLKKCLVDSFVRMKIIERGNNSISRMKNELEIEISNKIKSEFLPFNEDSMPKSSVSSEGDIIDN